MPLLEDLLLRFRRVWAPPGAVAGQAGVPSDLAANLDDELRDLTAELAAIDEEGDVIIRSAQSEAAAILDAARAESSRSVAAARAQAPDVRAREAAARVRDRHAEIDAVIDQAEQEAAAIRRRARSRMPPLVDGVTADVLAHAAPEEESHGRVMGGG